MLKDDEILFVKGRSHSKLDLLSAFNRLGRITLGYVAWNEEAVGDFSDEKITGKALSELFFLPSEAEKQDKLFKCKPKGARDTIKQNANLQSKTSGFVIIPRPKQGMFYVGKINGAFQKFEDECYVFDEKECKQIDELVKLEGQQNQKQVRLDLNAALIQGWPLEEIGGEGFLRPVRLYETPAMLRKIMAARRSHGHVNIDKDALPRFNKWLKDVFENKPRDVPKTQLEQLQFDLTTTSFEHVCVELLSCRDPNIKWMHVGGAGDGGIDGAGFNNGQLVRVLQCKYESNAKLKTLEKELREEIGKDPKIIFATLWDSGKWAEEAKKDNFDNCEILGPAKIKSLARKYQGRIPSISAIFLRKRQPLNKRTVAKKMEHRILSRSMRLK